MNFLPLSDSTEFDSSRGKRSGETTIVTDTATFCCFLFTFAIDL